MEQFQYPLPIIKSDIDHISIVTSGSFEGSFTIRNTGGGELSGKITSNQRGLIFYPSNFTGNKIDIKYVFNLDIYKKGDTIKSSALIMSNGGEIIIPVIIRIVPPAIMVKDHESIVTLDDFLFYVRREPIEARRLFGSKDFYMWLVNMNYEYIDMYEHLTTDTNKERAVENFLLFNKLKKKPKVKPLEQNIKLKIKESDRDPITGVIPFKLTGWGYVDTRLAMAIETPWLKILNEKITYADFDENGFYEASFIVYPALINKRAASNKIILIDEKELSGKTPGRERTNREIFVSVSKSSLIQFSISKDNFTSEDEGRVLVKNLSGKDVMIEIMVKDAFVKFEGNRYLISEYAEIPFSIKMNMLQSTQFLLRKQPVVHTEIMVKTTIGKSDHSKRFTLKIGQF